jgi:hypothetical protein
VNPVQNLTVRRPAARRSVLGFPVMRPHPLLLAALALFALAPRSACAQASTSADSGLFIVYDGATPIAHESYKYATEGNALLITATNQRQQRDAQGQVHAFKKVMQLVVDAEDFGLQRYTSAQDFQGQTITRSLVPSDTLLMYDLARDGRGEGVSLVIPPGRLFVMDSQMFTLFDVLCRSLASKQFASRSVQLLALLPDTLSMPLATVTLEKPDTLQSGARRVATRHYMLEDSSARFELWADAGGRLLRMTHPLSGLSVERFVDEPKRAATKPRAPARR